MSAFWQRLLRNTGLARRNRWLAATAELQRALANWLPPSGSAPTAAQAEAPHETPAAFPEPPLAPADAPAGAAPPGRFVAGQHRSAFGAREYKLFIPGGAGSSSAGDGSVARQPRPLVVMLHGCKQDPDDFALGTRMNEAAAREGLFVLYPQQPPRSNLARCWNWFSPGDQRRGAGEPALIAALVEHVAVEHGIDRGRIHVAGLSAGAAMAAILADRYGDVFAAGAIHSGLPPGAAHDVASAFQAMSAPVRSATIAPSPESAPLIVFHGDADTTVHPLNGRLVLAALLGSEPQPASCRASPAGQTGRGWTATVYRDEAASPGAPSRAELWLVHGGGHAWSGGDASGSYTDPAGPDATREVLRFFREHPMPRAGEPTLGEKGQTND